jgi:hypothetical protein
MSGFFVVVIGYRVQYPCHGPGVSGDSCLKTVNFVSCTDKDVMDNGWIGVNFIKRGLQ